MRKKVAALALAMGLGFLTFGASVGNAQKTQTYFSCKTKSGKIVRFSRIGNNVRYSYGKPGVTPDITFSVPLSSAYFKHQMFARGGEQSVSVDFNGTTYKGTSGFSGGYGDYGSILITRGNRTLAETECDRNMLRYLESNFEGTNAER